MADARTVELNDGTRIPEVVVEYPVGHRRSLDAIWVNGFSDLQMI